MNVAESFCKVLGEALIHAPPNLKRGIYIQCVEKKNGELVIGLLFRAIQEYKENEALYNLSIPRH